MLSSKWNSLPLVKWGGLASFLLAVAFIASSYIYFTGNLNNMAGAFAYSLADFMYGPIVAASMVTVVLALREHIGEGASRRMNMALLTAFAAACAFVAIAFIRSANRQYHLMHPDLHLEASTTVLIVWGTLVAGVTGMAWHFLGWALALIGSAGWTSRRLPRVLCVIYILAGITSMFVYIVTELEAVALTLGVAVSAWQGIMLLIAKPGEVQAALTN